MPIKGLTDQPMQFVEIGQLRKGAPKPEKGDRPGKDLTYFRATFLEGEDQAAEMFHGAYGGEPQEVNVRLPFNTVEENFDAWQESYVKGGLVHRCDGEHIQYEIDPSTGQVLVMDGRDEDGNPVKCDGSAECRPTGRLKVIVPELCRLAFMTALTTSVWDILNISRQLEAIRHVNDGQLQRVPLVLKRRPRDISTPSGSGGKRARRTKWLLSVEADPDWVQARVLKLAAPQPVDAEPLALPPGMPEPENGETWDQRYPASMRELVQWAGRDPYNFANGDIRAAVEKRLRDEFGESPPTPEDFKKEIGEVEAAAWMWEAVVLEHQVRQAPFEDEVPF